MLMNMPQEAQIFQIFMERKLSLGLAESCTAGALAARLTRIPGSSKYFKGSIVAYGLDAKINILQVSANTLNHFGAVSHETAKEMAKGALQWLNADIVLSTTGIAGPESDEFGTPIGTVFIGLASKEKEIFSGEYFFNGDRQVVIEQTIAQSLQLLLEYVRLY